MPEEPNQRVPFGMQQVPEDALPSAGAVVIARELLRREVPVDHAFELMGEHFIGKPRIDFFLAALTSFAPGSPELWRPLGDRVWLREWRLPGSPCHVIPPEGAGAEAALSMPWMSQEVRRRGIAVIPDSEALPPEAEQDRIEIASGDARALVTATQTSQGNLYGSFSIGSATPGPWPDEYVADMRLFGEVIRVRMQVEQARRSLADAIDLAEQSRSSQQQFLGTVGHELRTPVTAILGFADLLVHEAEQEVQSEGDFATKVAYDGGKILRAAEQLAGIVEDLLDAGRTLGVADARENLDVSEAVADVIHWHHTTATSRQVKVDSLIEPGSTHVHARVVGLRQILTNLIGNAIIHNGDDGHVEVTAERTLAEGRDPRVRIKVRDHGRGLTSQELSKVFEPFVRFADTGVQGTGLGLPLARAVAERDGGLVGAESTPGEGSVFWVDLPAAKGVSA